MRNLPESRRHAPVNSVIRKTTASMQSATAKERTRHTARSAVAPGKWDQTIYHHTHPPPPKANRAPIPGRAGLPGYAGAPAAGAGSRCTNCGPGSSCADEDGSAVGGGGGETGGSGGGGVGVGSSVCGSGCCSPVGTGSRGRSLRPGPAGVADALPRPDGVADADADSPDRSFPSPPRSPSPPTAPPYPAPAPDTAEPPTGAFPPCCPADCDGPARPASAPTLTQPAAAATTRTAAARRTGTYKGRTEATSEGGRAGEEVNLPNSRRPQEDTRPPTQP